MSEYCEIEVEYKDKEALAQALQEMFGHVKVHDEAQHLRGYRGDLRPQRAEIIVPKEYVGPGANDIGFQWDGKKYKAWISEFDLRHHMNNIRQQELAQRYAEKVVDKVARKNGWRVQKHRTAHQIVYTIQL